MNCVELKTRELSVVIGNNEAGDGERASHRAGYNGIWSLSSMHAPGNCFEPRYAGLNLEHCMDDLFMTGDAGDNYEPRHAPMRLTQLSPSRVRLTQDPTPLTGVESETQFDVIEPDTIDLRFRAILHRPPRRGTWVGFFWASYIQAPVCPALHFRDGNGMLNALCADRHGRSGANTVCHASVETPSLGRPDGGYADNSLAHSFSARRFGPSLMFGFPGNGRMLLLQMFDQRQPVRLTMSPTGGGSNKETKAFNPAWDFQYIVDGVGPGSECHLRTRLIYKPFTTLDEIDRLYAEWEDDQRET